MRQCPATAPRPNGRMFMSLWQYRTEEIEADPFQDLHDSKHAHRVSQQDTELSTKESCPAGAVQDTHCSGCCCCGAVAILETDHWTVYHSIADCLQDPLHFCQLSAVRAWFLPRSYCYGNARAPVVAENKRRWSSCDRAPRCAVTCWCSALWQWNSTMYNRNFSE